MTQNVTISYDTTAYNLFLDCSYYSIASFSPQDLHTMADRCFCFYLQSCKAQDNLKGFYKKKPQVIFEIWTGCFLWRRINRWTGCRDHSTVTYWSSVDKALPFNSNWQESRLLNRESSSFLPPRQLHGRVWGIETLPNVKPRYIITELPQFWRQQAVTTVFCHQILCSQTNTDKVQTNTDNSIVPPNTLFLN